MNDYNLYMVYDKDKFLGMFIIDFFEENNITFHKYFLVRAVDFDNIDDVNYLRDIDRFTKFLDDHKYETLLLGRHDIFVNKVIDFCKKKKKRKTKKRKK